VVNKLFRFTYLFCLFTILSIVFSCKKQFKPANPAFFITCQQIQLNMQPNQGYGSHKITELWLYTNGFFRGAYPIGSKMPVMIEDGRSVIDIFPGIMNNGISTTRIFYPFLEPLKIDTIVESGKSIVRNFTFEYKSNVKFPWVENFELPGTSLIKSAISDTAFIYHESNLHVFEGNKSIEFGLSGGHKIAQFESATTYSLPLASSNVYLEFDYKCNSEFEVGALSNTQYFSALVITPKENWNKIYIQLSTAINLDNSTNIKKIVFRMYRRSDIPNQKVYIDNIKLIHL